MIGRAGRSGSDPAEDPTVTLRTRAAAPGLRSVGGRIKQPDLPGPATLSANRTESPLETDAEVLPLRAVPAWLQRVAGRVIHPDSCASLTPWPRFCPLPSQPRPATHFPSLNYISDASVQIKEMNEF